MTTKTTDQESGQRADSLVAPTRPVSAVLQRKCACGNHTVGGAECESCKKGKGSKADDTLQRSAKSSGQVEEVPPVVHEVLNSPGQPLAPPTRKFMEPRFGQDFSLVRVHSDAQAAESARSVDAMAYTVGNHLVLDSQSLPDQSYAREKVLAHELTHVVQQSHNSGGGNLTVSNNLPLEAQADDAASKIISGHDAHLSSADRGGLMRMPRSMMGSVDPNNMSPDEIENEIQEINEYIDSAPLSQDTVDHLTQMRSELVAAQKRLQGPSSPSAAPSKRSLAPDAPPAQAAAPAPTASSTGVPFFGLQPADDAFHGIKLYYTVTSVPASSGAVHTFNRGPYLIALNHLTLPDGSRRISYYVAHRRADAVAMGNEGWNEYVVGPDSIQTFLDNLNHFQAAAALGYMFGPPSPYQAAAGRVGERMMEGDVSGAAGALGESWTEAVQDPSWWAGVAMSTAGAVSRVPTTAARPPTPPTLRVLPGRTGRVPMRAGPGGKPVVASQPRTTSPQAPVAQAGPTVAVEGNTLRQVTPAAAPQPVPAPAPGPVLVPDPVPGVGPAVPQPGSIGPAVGGVGAAATSVMGPEEAPGPAAPQAPALQLGTQPHQRKYETQTCTNEVLDDLQAQKDRICNTIPSKPDWSPSRSEKMLNRIKCSEIRPRLRAFEECLRIRLLIQERCFGGVPDPRHVIPLEEIENGIANGRARELINCAPGHPMANL